MSNNSFSHSLNLVDLNDYLGPSQICIKPTQTDELQPSISKTQIQLDDHIVSSDQPITTLKKAEITLNDCLACSGCITSAESILVSLQSVEEVLNQIKKPNQYPILSISSHSLASFVGYNNLNSLSVGFKVLRKYFSQNLNFKLVLDLHFSQRLHLWESQREFQRRRREGKEIDVSKIHSNHSPLLASSCPGWICYAEKTQGHKGILEMISQVKSAQQIQGSILKTERIASSLGVSIDQIYHVCVMSCYDKKLEASRSEFQNHQGIKDVDCVLTTREVQNLMERDGFDIHLAAQETQTEELVKNFPIEFDIPIWVDHPEPKGSSSGGYLFNLLRKSIPTEQDKINRLKLTVERKRGSDYVEFSLQLDHSHHNEQDTNQNDTQVETLFYGALFYGFKNLQNLIRKIASPSTITNPQTRMTGRRGRVQNSMMKKDPLNNNETKRSFDFVEVMACPSGCLNGGGQIPISKSSSISSTQWISKLEEIYFSKPSMIDKQDSNPLIIKNHHQEEKGLLQNLKEVDKIEFEEDEFIITWFKKWGIDVDFNEPNIPPLRNQIFYTCYKAIQVESNGFAVQW